MSEVFKTIELSKWRQFHDIRIEFDRHMTVLTGENGTGKTTILNILSRHFGWNLHLVSSPILSFSKREQRLFSDYWSWMESQNTTPTNSYPVGRIGYASGAVCELAAPPPEAKVVYDLAYSGQQAVEGIYIPSYRPAFSYHRVTQLPTDPQTTEKVFQQFRQFMIQQCQGGTPTNPGTVLKQSLIAFAAFAYDTPAMVGNAAYRDILARFQRILQLMLPKSLGFRELRIQVPDVILMTRTGDFPLDAASGGVGALFGIAWQVFMYGMEKEDCVVTLDEPELHLHPSMQRELLPSLCEAFPSTQFIVATHSPFIATSRPEASVCALAFDERGRVHSERLEDVDLAGTANETLREILGVPISVPLWVERRFSDIASSYSGKELTASTLRDLKRELVAAGLHFMLPDAVDSIRQGGCDEKHS